MLGELGALMFLLVASVKIFFFIEFSSIPRMTSMTGRPQVTIDFPMWPRVRGHLLTARSTQ